MKHTFQGQYHFSVRLRILVKLQQIYFVQRDIKRTIKISHKILQPLQKSIPIFFYTMKIGNKKLFNFITSIKNQFLFYDIN